MDCNDTSLNKRRQIWKLIRMMIFISYRCYGNIKTSIFGQLILFITKFYKRKNTFPVLLK